MANNNQKINAIKILRTVFKTYVNKDHDYGSAFDVLMDEDGPIYLKGKLTEKLFRFKTLIKQPPKVQESIQDTLYDIIGYCLLGLLWYKKHEAILETRDSEDSKE